MIRKATEQRLTKEYYLSLLLLVLSGTLSLIWGISVSRAVSNGGFLDFQNIYFGTECLLHHCDPYNGDRLDAFYQNEGIDGLYKKPGHETPTEAVMRYLSATLYVNLPTTFFVILPFTMLGWGSAHVLWISLIAAFFILASILMWRTAANYSPGISLLLVCLVLLSAELVFATGNTGGLVVSLCIIAVWCFVNERLLPFGMLCFAVSLAVKPHDAGLVWLFFLLSGGIRRRRALQVLAIDAALGLAGVIWVSLVAPHWLHEMRSNLSAVASPGGLNDPTRSSLSAGAPNGIVDLRTITSLFSNNPHIYNLVAYAVCGILLIVWSVQTLRSPYSREKAWFALAVIAPLTTLPTYHRSYDARLLLLTIPACAILWSEKGIIRWGAFLLNTAAILLVGDPSLAFYKQLTRSLHPSATGLSGKLLYILATRPVPLLLLVLSLFYLWIYLRRFTAGLVYGASHEPGPSVSANLLSTPVEAPQET